MGSWGYEVHENDEALDFQASFQDIMLEGKKSPYEAISLLLSKCSTMERVLMAGKIEMDIYGCVLHLDEVIDAIDDALLEENTNHWDNPEERVKELEYFKEWILLTSIHQNE